MLSGYLNGTAASYLPQCQDSGEYAPVQCDVRREQCWCVDTEGMEVYGTRQRGRPTRCKSPSSPGRGVCSPHGTRAEGPALGAEMKAFREDLMTSFKKNV